MSTTHDFDHDRSGRRHPGGRFCARCGAKRGPVSERIACRPEPATPDQLAQVGGLLVAAVVAQLAEVA